MTTQISQDSRYIGSLLRLKSVTIWDRPPLPSLRSQLSDGLLVGLGIFLEEELGRKVDVVPKNAPRDSEETNIPRSRLDLGQVGPIRLSKSAGVAGYVEDFAIENRVKMA